MMRIAIGKARGGQLSEPKTGLAATLLAWGQTAFRCGFASISGVRVERRMELVERLELGGKRQLMLVVCDGQRYLLAAGGDSIHSIVEMSQGVEQLRNFGNGPAFCADKQSTSIQPPEQVMRCSC